MLKFITFLLCSVSLFGVDLDNVNLEGKKVGYYLGSFDPLHLGHQHVVNKALESGLIDYVLIYPAPGGDKFKDRTDVAIRQRMIASVYRDHPKVLVTSWSPIELQNKLGVVVGIIGSDVVAEVVKYDKVFMRGVELKEKHYYSTIGALMALKADSFIVAARGNVDVGSMVGDRPVVGHIQSNGYSSTDVRNAIKEGRCYQRFLASSVNEIINELGLYGMKKGKIIILNGASSSGKSSIQKALLKKTDTHFIRVGIDTFFDALIDEPDLTNFERDKKFDQYTPSGEYIRGIELLEEDGHPVVPLKIGPAGDRIIFGMHRAIKAYADAGNNLIVDYIQYKESWSADLIQCLEGYSVYFVKVDAPLDVIEERERTRNTSPAGHARSHYATVHQGMHYDLELDSSTMTPEESADLINQGY